MDHIIIDTIKVYVTSNCNLRCKHCYQHFEKNKYWLPLEKITEIIDFAVKNGTRILDFSGGEFFTYPFAYEVLDYCYQKKVKVNLATNATLINCDFFSKYIDSDLLSVQVSVDGTKDTHDMRRGKGTYEKTLTNVLKLKEYHIPISASMALDEFNYQDAIDVLELPYFDSVYFVPVAYAGAAIDNRSEELISDYEDTIIYLLRKTECESDGFKSQIFPNTLAVKYDGGVYISPVAADYNLLCMGNVTQKSLSDIIADFLESQEFTEISRVDENTIDECNKCIVRNSCSRGCRLRALKFFGDLLRPDPFYCRIMNDDYKDFLIGKLFWGENE